MSNGTIHDRQPTAGAPAVSVIMTVFNGERYVAEAVASILEQSFRDFELVIVDNCSTDGTRAILESFADGRIKIVKNERNVGQTRALNDGIRASRASLIARMDADDIAEPNRLERQLAFLQRHPDIAVVGSWARFIDQDGRYLCTFKAPCEPDLVTMYMSGSPELSYGCTLHPTLIVRRDAIEAAGLYDETRSTPGFPQDYELWGRMILRGFKFANIGETLLRYRVLRNSESRGSREALRNHRLSISASRIRAYCPGFTDEETKALARMLEFRPQLSAAHGEAVLQLFDRYFSAYVARSALTERAGEIRSKLELYYLPMLYLTNRTLAVRRYLRLIRERRRLLLDRMFYRKVAKTVLWRGEDPDSLVAGLPRWLAP